MKKKHPPLRKKSAKQYPLNVSIKFMLVCIGVFLLFNSCNGVPNQQLKNDSARSAGIKEQDNNHSGGPGDSAKGRHTDSGRVVHGGELKN